MNEMNTPAGSFMDSIDEVDMPAFVDAHVHLRQNDLKDGSGLMNRVAHYSGKCCDHIIAMPNTIPPIHDDDLIAHMKSDYQDAVGVGTTVHMVAKWLPRTRPSDVLRVKNAGAIGFKLYPQGATTNSDDGIVFNDLVEEKSYLMDVLAEMEHRDLVLMCHGEAPGFVLDREDLFLPLLGTISDKFPKLRLTLEHISTANGINYVSYLDGIGRRILGTITLHHMMRTLNDVVGGKLQPDEFCMPIPKLPRDRVSITNAAFMNSKCFALGSDSAPHDQKMKYCKGGCAGVFTAPVLAESLMEMYRPSIAERFVNFTSKNAANFYGFQPSGRRIAFERKPWLVPATHGLVTTFRGLETLEWSLKTPSSFKGVVNS